MTVKWMARVVLTLAMLCILGEAALAADEAVSGSHRLGFTESRYATDTLTTVVDTRLLRLDETYAADNVTLEQLAPEQIAPSYEWLQLVYG